MKQKAIFVDKVIDSITSKGGRFFRKIRKGENLFEEVSSSDASMKNRVRQSLRDTKIEKDPLKSSMFKDSDCNEKKKEYLTIGRHATLRMTISRSISIGSRIKNILIMAITTLRVVGMKRLMMLAYFHTKIHI